MGYKVNKIYVGTSLVRPVWTPGSNTIAYFPLENDLLDHGPNNLSFTQTGTINYSTLSSGKKVATFSNSALYRNNMTSLMSGTKYTFSYWCNITYNTNYRSTHFIVLNTSSSTVTGACSMESSSGGYIRIYGNSSITGTTKYNGWNYYCFICDGTSTKIYVNGNLHLSGTATLSNIGTFGVGYGGANDMLKGSMSEFILENKVWSTSEISDYYNHTKSNYGL